ncbi:MAG: hypothetical protein MJ107_07395 [Lachnospiraceae bacterium]|nr:hypothetical protein [Lachnospiraceae bacterium]
MKRISLSYVFLALAIVIFFFSIFSVKAMGGNKIYFEEDATVAEEEYINNIKSVLADYYMGKSGVMLLKVSEDGVNIEYTVQIHTGSDNSQEMIDELKAVKLEVAASKVKFIFK